MKKIDKDVQYVLTKYGKTLTALGTASWDCASLSRTLILDNIKWTEKEYKEWVKFGWKKTPKGKTTEFVDFIQYLKTKYK